MHGKQTPHKGLQVLRERGQHSAANEIEQSLERWDEWLHWSNASWRERYFGHEARLHVHLSMGINGKSRVSHDYCISFESDRSSQPYGDLLDVPPRVFLGAFGWRVKSGPSACASCAEGELPVLVDPVEFMDAPEGVELVVRPAMVRLKRLDDASCRGRDAADFSRPLVGLHRPIEEHRKLGPLDLFLGHSRLVFPCERQGEMIEGRSEVVDAVSEHEAQTFGDRGNALDPEAAVLKEGDRGWGIDEAVDVDVRVGVWFIDESVGLSLNPLPCTVIQRAEVFFGPTEFGLKTGGHGVTST